MRKARFLMMFTVLFLLLFIIALLGCEGERPPEEPPADPPFVIEQGEILVSDYWKNDPIAVNPRPERVEGTPLCYEQIAYVRVGASNVDRERLFIADDLNEAAAVIRARVSDPEIYSSSMEAACEAVSHVDFSRFRLLLFLEVYGSGSLTHHYKMEGLIHNGGGKLTKMMLDPPLGDFGMTHDMAYMLRFVLVRRADYGVPAREAEGVSHFYRPYPDPIEQGEIAVSGYWQSAEPAENPCPEAVPGLSLPYEEIAFYKSYAERIETSKVHCADDLAAAALLIDDLVYGQGAEAVAIMREKVSHVDFSQFRLLALIEAYDESEHPFPFRLDALIHDGSGLLTAVCYRQEQSYPTYAVENDVCVRFVLVRRADYGVETDGMRCGIYAYSDPPNVIEQGEITVSALWDTIEHPTNYYKYYCDAPALQFEQLGMVAVEYKGANKVVFADDLADAAALIDNITSYNSAGCLALNEIASHVDFSEFRLMLIEEAWNDPYRMENCYLHTLIQKDNYVHTVYKTYDLSGFGGTSGQRYVRVLLVHRSQISSEIEEPYYQRHG